MNAATPFDAADYLTTPEDRAAYLQAAIEEGDSRLIAAALGDIARAVGVGDLAKRTGLSREALYKALSPDGNPTLDTLTRVTAALGLRLTVVPAP